MDGVAALGARLTGLYGALSRHFGHEPHWWPLYTDTPQFEVIVGAVLVQQTRWETVEAAVVRLREAGWLSPQGIAGADTAALAALIRPCAFHTQKAPGLQAICRHLLDRHAGDTARLFEQPRAALRAELLALPRVGRETADTMMLYGGGHPVFIVDAYARRLFERVGLLPGLDVARVPYDALQALVEQALLPWRPLPDAPHLDGSLRHFLWDFHALITEACIHHCLASRLRCDLPGARRNFVDPRKCAEHCIGCGGCPLRSQCVRYQRGPA